VSTEETTTRRVEGLGAALARVDNALRDMWRGDPLAYMDAWEHSAEVTLMGGLGPVEKGWDAVSDTLSWVGGKFGDGVRPGSSTWQSSKGPISAIPWATSIARQAWTGARFTSAPFESPTFTGAHPMASGTSCTAMPTTPSPTRAGPADSGPMTIPWTAGSVSERRESNPRSQLGKSARANFRHRRNPQKMRFYQGFRVRQLTASSGEF
jgi:hypothetical protein